MDQKTDEPGGPDFTPPQEPMDWREMRNQAREAWQEARYRRRMARGSRGWIAGAVLIALGFIFLLQNLMGTTLFQNWWALFIMIPAVGAFSTAWNQYQAAGRLMAGARRSLLVGTILTMVALIFLFNLNWTLLWPVLLIVGGVGLLLNAILPA